jgi:hypothetical protein
MVTETVNRDPAILLIVRADFDIPVFSHAAQLHLVAKPIVFADVPLSSASSSSQLARRPSQTWGCYRFRVVIGLGNEMKWRVLLELTEANGNVRRAIAESW